MSKQLLQLALKRVTIGLFLAFAFDCLLFRSGLYFRYVEPESTAGTVTLNEAAFDHEYRSGAKNVVVIGDSRVAEGFSTKIANAFGEKHGVNFIGLGLGGTTPRVWYYFLREIDGPAQPLAAVVLMATSLEDHGSFEDLRKRTLDISYMTPLLRTIDVPTFVESFPDISARVQALRAAAFPALALQSDLHAFLASPFTRIEKARQWQRYYSDSIVSYAGRPQRVPDLPHSVLLASSPDPSAVPSDLAQPLAAYLGNLRAMSGSAEEMKEYRHLWYGRIADYCQTQHTPVFVYQIPRGPFHKELVGDRPAGGSLLDLEHSGKMTLLPSAPFVELEQPQFFFDFLHLNAAGRQAFSERLAKIVTPLVP